MAQVKDEKSIDIEEKIDKAEHYVQENKKSLGIIGGAVLLAALGYFAYTNFLVGPQEKDAQKEIFGAEQYYAQDSFKLALNGDGNKMGFLQIIENYGSSKTANLAHYYAGSSYLRTGEFENAITYFKKYDAEDDVTGALALGGIGDANLELKRNDEALKYYKKAAEWDNNYFSAPVYLMKAAMVYELKNEWKSAADLYEKIKKDYPESTEAREIERYIARAAAMAEKAS